MQLFSRHEPASSPCLRKHALSHFIIAKLLPIVRFREISARDLAGIPPPITPSVPAEAPANRSSPPACLPHVPCLHRWELLHVQPGQVIPHGIVFLVFPHPFAPLRKNSAFSGCFVSCQMAFCKYRGCKCSVMSSSMGSCAWIFAKKKCGKKIKVFKVPLLLLKNESSIHKN